MNRLVILVALVSLTGCSQGSMKEAASQDIAVSDGHMAYGQIPPGGLGAPPQARSTFEIGPALPIAREPGGGQAVIAMRDASGSMPAAGEEGARQDKATAGRKIKYNGEVRLVVNDFDRAEEQLHQLVHEQQAYLAQSAVSGSSGQPRAGQWHVRVPVDRFEAFVAGARKIGVPQTARVDSEDVTAQYVDLEARLKNKKDEEETLRGYLKEKKGTSELKDILTVEKELARVRGEIEQMEGELRVLTNLTALASVTVVIQEIKNYVPPQTPTFASTVSTTFGDSVDALVRFGKATVILGAAVTPWLPVVGLVVGMAWGLVRVLRRRVVAPTPAA
jgi:hypothetical protein